MDELISRQAAIDAIKSRKTAEQSSAGIMRNAVVDFCIDIVKKLPSAQLGQRYTNEELMIFQHGISLSLLSKRSSQHWQYDEDTATEIKFLERLYEKVVADMRGEQDG